MTRVAFLMALMFALAACDNPFEERQSCPYQKCPEVPYHEHGKE
jgi:hypothetical protein